jgi:predicted TIM-barrel fold metal-dependent hydrolase
LLETLRELGRAKGITHFVIVQPSFYGRDNSALLDALDALQGAGRGVAVVAPDNASDEYLSHLHERGVRGLRVNLYSPLAGKALGALDADFNAIAEIARRRAWHVEVVAPIEILAAHADVLRRSPVPVVIDHYGLYGDARPDSAPGRALLDLMRSDNVWMKLSAPYRHDRGPMNVVPDRTWLNDLLSAAPDRCVWGSDWPHPPTHASQMGPDTKVPYRPLSYSGLVNRFVEAIPAAAFRDAVMWDNPSRLYQFGTRANREPARG